MIGAPKKGQTFGELHPDLFLEIARKVWIDINMEEKKNDEY